MRLSVKAAGAGGWLLSRRVLASVVNIGVLAYLARTLEPRDFGLAAVAAAVLSLISTMGTAGIADYIIYFRGEQEIEVINSTFWLTATMTLAIGIVGIASAPLWALAYDDDAIVPVCALLVVSMCSEVISSIPKALFRKTLDLGPMVTVQLVSEITVALAKIGCAYAGLGVYSLVLPSAVVAPVETVVLYRRGDVLLARFDARFWRQIFGYSKHTLLTRVLTRVVNEGDTLIIGALLGVRTAGIYDLAFRLANFVINNFLFIVSTLILPVFSEIRTQVERTRNAFIRMVRLIGFIATPVTVFVFVFADKIVYVLYGDQWTSSIAPLRIMCAFALTRAFGGPCAAMFPAFGKPDLNSRFSVVLTPVFLLSVFLGAKGGLNEVAGAVTAVRVAGDSYFVIKAVSATDVEWGPTIKAMTFPLVAALLASVAALGAFGWVENVVGLLVGSAILYALAYLLVLRFAFPSELQTVLQLGDQISARVSRHVRVLLRLESETNGG